jgi:hypothetical protein
MKNFYSGIYLLFLKFLMIAINSNAQISLTTGGGEIKGEGGTVSQSIGQLSYTTIGDDNYQATQGVIQVYDIQVISGIENTAIGLFYNAYPNPVADMLTLMVENYDKQLLEYELFDALGKRIGTGKITDKMTQISTIDLIPAAYYLHVMYRGKAEKSFKIVKI